MVVSLTPLHRRRSRIDSPTLRISSCWGVLLVAGYLLSGCAFFKDVEPAFPPTAQGPNLEAQTRLLEEARSLVQRGHGRTAVSHLRQLMVRYPDSPFLPEIRWELARAYEQVGSPEAAIEQYRAIVEAELTTEQRWSDRALDAQRRITVLEPNLEIAAGRSPTVTAVLLAPPLLPQRDKLSVWLGELRRAGLNTLVLEIGSRSNERAAGSGATSRNDNQSPAAAGVYFRTTWATVLEDTIDQVVPLAHQQGIAVFGAVTLRRMSWLEPPVGWADAVYDRREGRVRRSQALDLFNPAFQEYLTGLLTDLAATGIDGLLFRADAPMGPSDGFSSFGLNGFRARFDVGIDPGALLTPTGHETPSGSAYPPEFWKWAGWKARERLKILGELRTAMQASSPKLRFAIELHREAVSNPVGALVEYGEDLIESKRARFDYIVTGLSTHRPGSHLKTSTPSQGSGTSNGQGEYDSTSRLIQLMGEAHLVWEVRRLAARDSAALSTQINPGADRVRLPAGIGLLYLWEASPVP